MRYRYLHQQLNFNLTEEIAQIAVNAAQIAKPIEASAVPIGLDNAQSGGLTVKTTAANEG
ncbi:MAG: hypothetical protein AAGI28_01655 [Pseudomonadota bacterium]